MNCARCETRPMIRTEALQPAAHVITATHTCPARHIALAYPAFLSICYSNPNFSINRIPSSTPAAWLARN